VNERSKTARKGLLLAGVGEELVHSSFSVFFGSFALVWFWGLGLEGWNTGTVEIAWSGPKSGKDANLSQSRAQQGGRSELCTRGSSQWIDHISAL
jgi:hypothetical protein